MRVLCWKTRQINKKAILIGICQRLNCFAFCYVDEADVDRQLDDIEAREIANKELDEVKGDENEVSEDVEQENKENDEAVDEQQTEEVSTTVIRFICCFCF